MPEKSLSPYAIKLRTDEVLKTWRKETMNRKAVPLLCVSGVVGEGGTYPIGTYLTINNQGRTQQDVLELLRDITRALEAQMQ